MKKLMVLMFVSFLTLAGCGGGGGGDITAGIPGVPDESPNVISNPVVDPVAGPMGRITVNFEPQETPRALISSTGWIRNHARLVVRQFGEVEIPGAPIYGELICDDEVPDDCSRSIDGYQPSTFEYKEIPNTKKISDSALNPDGSGSVSIAVPPGAGYTLEILTYFSDKTGKMGQMNLLAA